MTLQANALWFSAAITVVTVAPARAGPCTAEIARLEHTFRDSAANPLAGPTASQSVAAQLGRQPTPSSVQAAEERAQARFQDNLAHARALDAQGRDAECAQTLRGAKLMLGM